LLPHAKAIITAFVPNNFRVELSYSLPIMMTDLGPCFASVALGWVIIARLQQILVSHPPQNVW